MAGQAAVGFSKTSKILPAEIYYFPAGPFFQVFWLGIGGPVRPGLFQNLKNIYRLRAINSQAIMFSKFVSGVRRDVAERPGRFSKT